MGQKQRRRLNVEDTPQEIRDAISRDVKRRGRTVNDIVCHILAERYGIPYKRTGRKPFKTEVPPILLLKVPDDLWFALKIRAAETGGTVRGLILFALAQHYKLATELTTKRRPSRL